MAVERGAENPSLRVFIIVLGEYVTSIGLYWVVSSSILSRLTIVGPLACPQSLA